MPWVKIDAAASTHPKQLKAGPLACWLWVAGLCYCHTHKTDGFLPVGSLSSLSPLRYASQSARRLVAVGLWEEVEGGWHVHDYGKFQQSKCDIEAKQARIHTARAEAGSRGGKKKAANIRASKVSKPLATETAIAEQNIALSLKNRERAPTEKRKRPIFEGERLVVFEWMVDELNRTLGPQFAESFDLHDWFFKADELAKAESVVNADWWSWLKAMTLDEARRRGLPVALPAPQLGKQSTRLATALANIKARGE